MAINFKEWLDILNVGQNVQAADVFATDDQRSKGFTAGQTASSIRVNSALRQSSLITVAFMNHLDSILALPSGLSLLSTVADVQAAIAASMNKNNDNVLNAAKDFTRAETTRAQNAEASLQEQITTNAGDATTSLAGVNAELTQIKKDAAALSATVATNKTSADATQTALTALTTRVTNAEAAIKKLQEPYEVDIAMNAWSGSAGAYTYSITAATHGRGKRPQVHTYVAGEETYDSPNINFTNGNVTLYSNTAIALHVIIW